MLERFFVEFLFLKVGSSSDLVVTDHVPPKQQQSIYKFIKTPHHMSLSN